MILRIVQRLILSYVLTVSQLILDFAIRIFRHNIVILGRQVTPAVQDQIR